MFSEYIPLVWDSARVLVATFLVPLDLDEVLPNRCSVVVVPVRVGPAI